MPLPDLIISAFCIIDDALKNLKIERLRQRGFEPSLSDSEIITMEIVGEFLEFDTDKGLWSYFKEHWAHFFPKIPCRTTFVRHAANLWRVKQLLQESLAKTLGGTGDILHVIDGFPMPVCSFGYAPRCKSFKSQASHGYCATKKEHYYGFKGHLTINSCGVICSSDIAAAHIDERDVAPSITETFQGLLLGDKGYIRPGLNKEAAKHNLAVITPTRKNMKKGPWDKAKVFFGNSRRMIETIISQLTVRFNIEKVRARDVWHLTSRWSRKILAHTTAIFINYLKGVKLLDFNSLLY